MVLRGAMEDPENQKIFRFAAVAMVRWVATTRRSHPPGWLSPLMDGYSLVLYLFFPFRDNSPLSSATCRRFFANDFKKAGSQLYV